MEIWWKDKSFYIWRHICFFTVADVRKLLTVLRCLLQVFLKKELFSSCYCNVILFFYPSRPIEAISNLQLRELPTREVSHDIPTDWTSHISHTKKYVLLIASSQPSKQQHLLHRSEAAYLLQLWSGACLFRFHLGHQGEGCQTRGGSSCCCGDDSRTSTTSRRLSDGTLRLRGWGLFIVETLGVAAWRGHLDIEEYWSLICEMEHMPSFHAYAGF